MLLLVVICCLQATIIAVPGTMRRVVTSMVGAMNRKPIARTVKVSGETLAFQRPSRVIVAVGTVRIVATVLGAAHWKTIVKAPVVVPGFMPIVAVGTTRNAGKMIGATRRIKTARSVEMAVGLIPSLLRPVARLVGSGVPTTRLVVKVWCAYSLTDIPVVADKVRKRPGSLHFGFQE